MGYWICELCWCSSSGGGSTSSPPSVSCCAIMLYLLPARAIFYLGYLFKPLLQPHVQADLHTPLKVGTIDSNEKSNQYMHHHHSHHHDHQSHPYPYKETASPAMAAAIAQPPSTTPGSTIFTAPGWIKSFYSKFPLVVLEQEDEVDWKVRARQGEEHAVELWVSVVDPLTLHVDLQVCHSHQMRDLIIRYSYDDLA